MDEKIISIHPFSSNGYDGFEIETTEQVISFGIENTNLCCEEFGIELHLPEDQDCIDAIVENSPRWSTINKDGFASIELDTNLGTIVIEAFNHHNGYYSHNIHASWKDYSETQEL